MLDALLPKLGRHDGLVEVVERTNPGRAQGPLPILLIVLTVVTGLVDAFSYLSLGHVFVANMTGNVVFLGFGLTGAGDIAIAGSVVAILAFAIGAAIGGRWAMHKVPHRGHLLAIATAMQAGLVIGRCRRRRNRRGAKLGAAPHPGLSARCAMGGQNAIARRLAVPDLTTTVLTLTVTGLVADATTWSVRSRRVASIASMLGGALVGGALLRWVSTTAPLWLAAAFLGSCAVTALVATRRPQSLTWR